LRNDKKESPKNLLGGPGGNVYVDIAQSKPRLKQIGSLLHTLGRNDSLAADKTQRLAVGSRRRGRRPFHLKSRIPSFPRKRESTGSPSPYQPFTSALGSRFRGNDAGWMQPPLGRGCANSNVLSLELAGSPWICDAPCLRNFPRV